jgi:hypothetical protein
LLTTVGRISGGAFEVRCRQRQVGERALAFGADVQQRLQRVEHRYRVELPSAVVGLRGLEAALGLWDQVRFDGREGLVRRFEALGGSIELVVRGLSNTVQSAALGGDAGSAARVSSP